MTERPEQDDSSVEPRLSQEPDRKLTEPLIPPSSDEPDGLSPSSRIYPNHKIHLEDVIRSDALGAN